MPARPPIARALTLAAIGAVAAIAAAIAAGAAAGPTIGIAAVEENALMPAWMLAAAALLAMAVAAPLCVVLPTSICTS
ncbi:hypothetical protein D3C84_1162700 [compost metagenome]